MDIDVFRFCIKELQDNFRKQFAKDQINLIWPAVKDCPNKAMEEAYNHIMLNFASLPTPARVKDVVEQEAKKIGQQRAQRMEEEAAESRRNYPEITKVQPNTDLGKDAIRAMSRLFSGIIDKRQYLKECGEVALKHRMEDTAKWVTDELARAKLAANG